MNSNTCLHEDDLWSLALGENTDGDLQMHLQQCPDCRRRVAQLQSEITTLRSAAEQSPILSAAQSKLAKPR